MFGRDRLRTPESFQWVAATETDPPIQAVLQGQGSKTEESVVNILQRYVTGEVLRAFLLSLLTMTIIFVLFMVAAEAMRSKLLGPQDVAQLIPYVVPSTLPYTIPVSLLFAVTVVYGRIAGDNEIIAVKSAGLSVMTVIWPTIWLAIATSLFLLYVSRGWIPESAHNAKLVLFKDVEDTFYKFLKRDREFNNGKWPFLIKVSDVDGRIMKDATFNKRAKAKDGSDTYSATIFAKRAELHFALKEGLVRVHLDQAEIQNYGADSDAFLVNRNILEMPIPHEGRYAVEQAVQEYTNEQIEDELAKARDRMAKDRIRQAMTVGFQAAGGKFDEINWDGVQKTYADYSFLEKRVNAFETEKQFRFSMAFGSLLFVLLGAPVGILFAKRDFLSAFMTCFLPVIGAYYPFMLLGMNLGKEGQLDPRIALWIGNAILFVGACLVYPRVIKY
jgi:lipopolysaccharide export system permease protein